MKKLNLILTSVFLTINTYAQVSIGFPTQPAEGSLLQLKENDNLGANATKGLMLPRVALVNYDDLNPIDDNSKKLDYIGLVVYNITSGVPEPTSACDPTPDWSKSLTKGIRIWTGENWESISENASTLIPPSWISPDVKFIKDHEGNVYPVRQFGDEGIWMLENLRTKTIPAGRAKYASELCGSVQSTLENEKNFKKACYHYISPPYAYKPNYNEESYPAITDDTFFKQYPNIGLLYNYNLLFNGEEPTQTDLISGYYYPKKDAQGRPTSFIQGICPDGWHIPYQSEFSGITDYITSEALAGNEDTSGVDLDFMTANSITSSRLPLTNCLPMGQEDNTRGASKIALKGGFAALWVGADSPYPAPGAPTTSLTGPKEYGVLAVFSSVKNNKKAAIDSETIYEYNAASWISNFWIRPSGSISTTNAWVTGSSYVSNMYSARCKKDNLDTSDLLTYDEAFN